jgi:hypothetical protein
LKVFLKGFIDLTKTEIWGNVLHFRYAGTPPVGTGITAIANNIGLAWQNNVASLCPSPTHLSSVEVTDLTSDTAGQAILPMDVPGTRGDDSIAANAAVLCSYPSPLRYKGGHPRTYLYVLGNADFNGAMHWTQAATDEVNAHWIAFLQACSQVSGGGATLGSFCFVRYKGKFLPNSGPPHFYLDTPMVGNINPFDTVTSNQVSSQRGRVGRRSA